MKSKIDVTPLVTVGVPTYNRSKTLKDTLESILSQDYANIELVISDDASTDDTRILCEEFARRDSRIKYIRQSENRGMSANFIEVLNRANGEFFMWLSDDDWLNMSYISSCVKYLFEHPDYVLASGMMMHYDIEGKHQSISPLLDFDKELGSDRVVSYFRHAGLNDDVLYGVIRRQMLLYRSSLRNTLGADWLMVASLIFMGKTHTVVNAIGHRRAGGTSKTYENYCRVFGIPNYIAKIPYIHLAPIAFRDIVFESPAYKTIRRTERILLALKVCAILFFLEVRRCYRRVCEFIKRT